MKTPKTLIRQELIRALKCVASSDLAKKTPTIRHVSIAEEEHHQHPPKLWVKGNVREVKRVRRRRHRVRSRPRLLPDVTQIYAAWMMRALLIALIYCSPVPAC